MPRRRPALHALALTLLLSPLGCDAGPSTQPTALPVVSMTIGNKTYRLEVAADDPSREHGLMERDALAADGGMIFVFPSAEPRGFWMHHTRFPLDILFLGPDGTVVSVHTMRAYDENTTPSDGPAKYAVELNANEAASAGVKAGEKLSVPPGVGAARS